MSVPKKEVFEVEVKIREIMNKVGELERIGEGGELDGMGKEKKEILRAELAS